MRKKWEKRQRERERWRGRGRRGNCSIFKKFKVKTPDWTQIKYNLKILTSETNQAPAIKPFENLRQNIEKQC